MSNYFISNSFLLVYLPICERSLVKKKFVGFYAHKSVREISDEILCVSFILLFFHIITISQVPIIQTFYFEWKNKFKELDLSLEALPFSKSQQVDF